MTTVDFQSLAKLVTLETGRERITADTSIDELGVDSLEFVSLMQQICEQFGDIPVERWGNLNTIADICKELSIQ